MPRRYPALYPELFDGLDEANTAIVLQSIGSKHDGSLRPRADVAEAVVRGKRVARRLEELRNPSS